jgi:hypothetical protein
LLKANAALEEKQAIIVHERGQAAEAVSAERRAQQLLRETVKRHEKDTKEMTLRGQQALETMKQEAGKTKEQMQTRYDKEKRQ